MLREHDVNYKRSNNDIEILYINAKDKVYKDEAEEKRGAVPGETGITKSAVKEGNHGK